MSAVSEKIHPTLVAHTPGVILALARRERNLDKTEISSHLRLSVWQVDALENDQYERLAGPTFIRGIIRSYAKTLGIDPQPALDAYNRVAPEAERVAINVPSQNIRFNPRGPGGWPAQIKVGVAFLALAVVCAGIWFSFATPENNVRRADPVPALKLAQESLQAKSAPVNLPSPTALTPSPVATSLVSEVVAPVELKPSAVQVADPLPVQATSVADERKLRLTFYDRSWVEVKDGAGKIVFSQNNPEGSSRLITGRPPFSLVIGNAASVRLTYDDKQVDLAPYTKIRVARLTLP